MSSYSTLWSEYPFFLDNGQCIRTELDSVLGQPIHQCRHVYNTKAKLFFMIFFVNNFAAIKFRVIFVYQYYECIKSFGVGFYS